MPAYRGKNVVVLFNAVDISGDGRSVAYAEKADALDTSAYGTQRRTKIGGLEDGSGSFEALDTTGAWSAVWEALQVGQLATLQVRPEGTGAGLRQSSFTALITERSIELPYDDLATLAMSFEMSGDVTETEQA